MLSTLSQIMFRTSLAAGARRIETPPTQLCMSRQRQLEKPAAHQLLDVCVERESLRHDCPQPEPTFSIKSVRFEPGLYSWQPVTLYLSIYLSICPSIHPPIYLSIYSSVNICASIFVPVYLLDVYDSSTYIFHELTERK